jgi:hypothetical protein
MLPSNKQWSRRLFSTRRRKHFKKTPSAVLLALTFCCIISSPVFLLDLRRFSTSIAVLTFGGEDNVFSNIKPTPARGQLFLCGHSLTNLANLAKHLFPEWTFRGKWTSGKYSNSNTTSANDVMLVGMHGACDGVHERPRLIKGLVMPNTLRPISPEKSSFTIANPMETSIRYDIANIQTDSFKLDPTPIYPSSSRIHRRSPILPWP